MSYRNQRPSIAVIGAGISGAACAAGLAAAGWQVTLFDKAREVGGRMATRQAAARLTSAAGLEHDDSAPRSDSAYVKGVNGVSGSSGTSATSGANFDHGAQQFTAQSPRFRALLARAEKLGRVARWQQRVSANFPASTLRERFVPTPDMPALCRHLLEAVPVRLGHHVQRLYRGPFGWQLALANGGSVGAFDQVLLAMPPAQAALLLAGHQDDWADALAAVPMTACWTLMAVTDEVDWPWDAAEPDRGPLALIARDDRKPGRLVEPGRARWVAHASPEWSALHLDDDPNTVATALRAALLAQLPAPPGTPSAVTAGAVTTSGSLATASGASSVPVWHQSRVHRWRYATLAQPSVAGADCWWDRELGLGVCGEIFGDGTIERAWSSGDELADVVAAGLEFAETALDEAPAPAPGLAVAATVAGNVVAATSMAASPATPSNPIKAILEVGSPQAMH